MESTAERGSEKLVVVAWWLYVRERQPRYPFVHSEICTMNITPRSLLACVLLIAAGAARAHGQAPTPASVPELTRDVMAREAALWGAAKARRFDDFRALLAPGYMAVYGSGRADADRDVANTQRMIITAVSFDSISVTRLDSHTVVDTYRVQLDAHVGDRDISGLYWSSSTWHRDGHAGWRLALHTETKAPPAVPSPQ